MELEKKEVGIPVTDIWKLPCVEVVNGEVVREFGPLISLETQREKLDRVLANILAEKKDDAL